MFSCISTQRDFCAQHTRDDCNLEEINSTCCALCGNSPVDPTAQPCLGDINNYECTITIRSNPSRCYDNQFYSECCESCNNARMDWLPSGNVYVSGLLQLILIGHWNYPLIYWKFPMILIQHSVKICWLSNTQSRVMQADLLLLENNEKAIFSINMPYRLWINRVFQLDHPCLYGWFSRCIRSCLPIHTTWEKYWRQYILQGRMCHQPEYRSLSVIGMLYWSCSIQSA